VYRTGQALAQPWVQTPAFLEDRARRVHAALTALNDVITELVRARRLSTDAPKYKAWKALLHNWGEWYGGTGITTWLWTGTDATLETYELAIRDWTRWVEQNFPGTDLPTPPPTFGPGGEREALPAWAIAALLMAGGFLAFKVLSRS